MADNVRDITMNVTANTRQAEESLARLKGATEQAGQALDKKKESAVNAGGAVISFGRIIQDAPFGIIGVANNITMLSEQFVALRQQAGGTQAALQAMLSGVMGPMGFTLAISAITTALQYWALQSNKTKKAVDALADSVKKIVQFKSPFENFVLTFDTKNIDKAISLIQGKLSDYSYKVSSVTGSPSEVDRQDPDKLAKRAADMFSTQKEYLPKIEVLKKTLEYLQTIKKEVDSEAKVFETLNGLLNSNLKDEVDKPFKTQKVDTDSGEKIKERKEKVKEIQSFYETLKDEIVTSLEIDDLLGKKTGKSVYENYLKIIGEEISSGKVSQKELLEWLRLRKEVQKAMDEDFARERTKGFDFMLGFDYDTMKGINKLGSQAEKQAARDAKEAAKEKLKAEKEAAKKQFETYKNYFIDPFTDAFKGEFSKAWQSIFGEANSLLEKFIQSLSEKLFNYGVEKAAYGIMDLIFPGAGALGGAISGGGADGRTVNQIIIDGELIATQKQATRIKAQLDRQASLR